MLLRRRSHPALCLSTSLRRWVLARSASSFSVDASVQITAHSAVLIDAATQLDLTGWIYPDSPLDRRHPFVSPRHRYWAHMWHLYRRLDLNNQPLPVIATQPQSLTNVSSSHCPILQPTASTTHVGTPSSPCRCQEKCQYRPCGKPQTLLALVLVLRLLPSLKPNAVILPCYTGQTAPLTAFSCGEQVPDVGMPHYRDARMQHSQSR